MYEVENSNQKITLIASIYGKAMLKVCTACTPLNRFQFITFCMEILLTFCMEILTILYEIRNICITIHICIDTHNIKEKIHNTQRLSIQL